MAPVLREVTRPCTSLKLRRGERGGMTRLSTSLRCLSAAPVVRNRRGGSSIVPRLNPAGRRLVQGARSPAIGRSAPAARDLVSVRNARPAPKSHKVGGSQRGGDGAQRAKAGSSEPPHDDQRAAAAR